MHKKKTFWLHRYRLSPRPNRLIWPLHSCTVISVCCLSTRLPVFCVFLIPLPYITIICVRATGQTNYTFNWLDQRESRIKRDVLIILRLLNDRRKRQMYLESGLYLHQDNKKKISSWRLLLIHRIIKKILDTALNIHEKCWLLKLFHNDINLSLEVLPVAQPVIELGYSVSRRLSTRV